MSHNLIKKTSGNEKKFTILVKKLQIHPETPEIPGFCCVALMAVATLAVRDYPLLLVSFSVWEGSP